MFCFISLIVYGSLYVDVQEVNIFQYSFFLILYKYVVTSFVFYDKEKGEEAIFQHLPHKSPFS